MPTRFYSKYTLKLEASARRAPVGVKQVSIYICKAKQVSGVLGVESLSNNDSPPHRHRLQNEMLQGGFGDFYSIATVACGKEAMASTVAAQRIVIQGRQTQNSFKPLACRELETTQTLPAQNVGARHTTLHSLPHSNHNSAKISLSRSEFLACDKLIQRSLSERKRTAHLLDHLKCNFCVGIF